MADRSDPKGPASHPERKEKWFTRLAAASFLPGSCAVFMSFLPDASYGLISVLVGFGLTATVLTYGWFLFEVFVKHDAVLQRDYNAFEVHGLMLVVITGMALMVVRDRLDGPGVLVGGATAVLAASGCWFTFRRGK